MQNPEPHLLKHGLETPASLPHYSTVKPVTAFSRVSHECLHLYTELILAIHGQWLQFRAVTSATMFVLENYFLINLKPNGKQFDQSVVWLT